MRRRGRPGLVGTMARTAVITGTATAVHGNMAQRRQAQAQAGAEQQAAQQAAYESQAQVADMQAQISSMQAQQPPAEDDMLSKLKSLGELHSSGILTDEEFAAAKAKLLA